MVTTTLHKDKSEAHIEGVLEVEVFMALWPKALKKVQEIVQIDGFRKGHVPETVIVSKFGDMVVLEEMAQMAISDIYQDAIKEQKLFPVAPPIVTIKKLAKDNPFEVTIVAPILLDVELPDVKKIASSTPVSLEEVNDSDVEAVLKELQHNKFHTDNKNHEGHDHGDHQMPALDDAFAQSFGESFKTLDDLKAKIKENLSLEKKQKAKEKARQSFLEEVMKVSTFSVHEKLVEDELMHMIDGLKRDVASFGGKWEEYLSHLKKTEDELKASMADDAKKRVMSQIIIAKIAEQEKLLASDEEIDTELVRFMHEVKDADEKRARDYLRQVLTNQKVFDFLGL